MSTIRVYPAVAGALPKVVWAEHKSGSGAVAERPHGSEQELMYPWSIGVTDAAHEMERRQEPEVCDCPPEVYIG